MPHSIRIPALVCITMSILTAGGGSDRGAHADDWPQWRGPRRDAVSAETGLLQTWPDGGPRTLWHTNGLGTGYSSVVVGHGRLFTMGRQGSDVVVTALDEVRGTSLWTKKIGETSRNPCSTPTLDGEFLYALDPDGDLVCLKAASGELVWTVNFVDQFGGRMMSGRGYGESPLIDGDRLICTPGGADAMLVALDKRSGAVIWKAKLPEIGAVGRDGAGFSSVVVTEAAGVRQYVQLVGRGLVGIDARDGRFLWGYNDVANNTANIPTPIVHKEFVFAANGYSAGSVLLKLVADGQNGETVNVKAELVYSLSASQFQNHHGGVVLLGDFLYAGHGNNNGLPTCLEFKTGRVVWKRRGPGTGSAALVSADGQLYFRYQNGLVALIEASDRGYNLQGTLEIPGAGGDSWAHPVVANGRLYLREQDVLWVYDLRKDSAGTSSASLKTPLAEPTVAMEKLRKLNVAVESLSEVTAASSSPAGESKPRRLYESAISASRQDQPRSVILITLDDSHLSTEGMLAAPELLALLKDLRRDCVVNLAGTKIEDAGLKQLQGLPIVGLNLELCRHVTDSGLKHLEPLKSLRQLILTGTGISHTGLQHLTGHSNLLALDLELCDGITDQACASLGQMKQLRSLNLKKSGFEKFSITDSGLQRLEILTELESLNLYGNKVTDTGLASLRQFKKLRELNLSLMSISDAGLRNLIPLTTLEHLELLYSEGFAGPTLTDGLVDSLVPLSNLRTLNLTGARLSDTGLKRLNVLKALQRLQLVRTRVTPEGIQAFEIAVPDCHIVK